jgi:hypothetical protein
MRIEVHFLYRMSAIPGGFFKHRAVLRKSSEPIQIRETNSSSMKLVARLSAQSNTEVGSGFSWNAMPDGSPRRLSFWKGDFWGERMTLPDLLASLRNADAFLSGSVFESAGIRCDPGKLVHWARHRQYPGGNGGSDQAFFVNDDADFRDYMKHISHRGREPREFSNSRASVVRSINAVAGDLVVDERGTVWQRTREPLLGIDEYSGEPEIGAEPKRPGMPTSAISTSGYSRGGLSSFAPCWTLDRLDDLKSFREALGLPEPKAGYPEIEIVDPSPLCFPSDMLNLRLGAVRTLLALNGDIRPQGPALLGGSGRSGHTVANMPADMVDLFLDLRDAIDEAYEVATPAMIGALRAIASSRPDAPEISSLVSGKLSLRAKSSDGSDPPVEEQDLNDDGAEEVAVASNTETETGLLGTAAEAFEAALSDAAGIAKHALRAWDTRPSAPEWVEKGAPLNSGVLSNGSVVCEILCAWTAKRLASAAAASSSDAPARIAELAASASSGAARLYALSGPPGRFSYDEDHISHCTRRPRAGFVIRADGHFETCAGDPSEFEVFAAESLAAEATPLFPSDYGAKP